MIYWEILSQTLIKTSSGMPEKYKAALLNLWKLAQTAAAEGEPASEWAKYRKMMDLIDETIRTP